MSLENNGFSNIIFIVQMAVADGTMDKETADQILEQAKQGVRYIKRRNDGEECKWHDCKEGE